MVDAIRGLSPRAEFSLVLLLGFGFLILGNVASLFYSAQRPAITNESLRSLLVFEAAVLALLGPLLYVRGWRLSKLGPPFSLSELRAGLVLTVIAYVLSSAVLGGLAAIAIGDISATRSLEFISNDIELSSLVGISLLNPVFEEFLLCGYMVTALKERRGFWVAVNGSLAVRLACHLYQGAIGVLSIVPLGFVFTYWYARTGRLWPVIIAHALFDAIGLWPYLAR